MDTVELKSTMPKIKNSGDEFKSRGEQWETWLNNWKREQQKTENTHDETQLGNIKNARRRNWKITWDSQNAKDDYEWRSTRWGRNSAEAIFEEMMAISRNSANPTQKSHTYAYCNETVQHQKPKGSLNSSYRRESWDVKGENTVPWKPEQ